MQKDDIEKLAKLMALDMQRITQERRTKPKENKDRLYKVTLSFRPMFGLRGFGETVFVLAKNDVEAEKKAESNKRFKDWEVSCIERQKEVLIF